MTLIGISFSCLRASLGAQLVMNFPTMWETQVQSLGQEDPPEKGMATHSSILAWRIPWTEEPGELQSMGSQRVRLDWVTETFTFFSYTVRHSHSLVDSDIPCICNHFSHLPFHLPGLFLSKFLVPLQSMTQSSSSLPRCPIHWHELWKALVCRSKCLQGTQPHGF